MPTRCRYLRSEVLDEQGVLDRVPLADSDIAGSDLLHFGGHAVRHLMVNAACGFAELEPDGAALQGWPSGVQM